MAQVKSIVQTLEDVAAWFDAEVCQHVTFKRPSNDFMDEDYAFESVHPKSFAMVKPTSDMLEDGITPEPSVTIRLASQNASNDDLQHGTRTISLMALFATWNPGLHGQDVLIPVGNDTYKRQSGQSFAENLDGWHDAWNFVDFAIQRIESVDYVGGLLVNQKQGIDFVFLDDAYPFWFAQVNFSLTAPIVESHLELQEIL